jgi:hypothetical protein
MYFKAEITFKKTYILAPERSSTVATILLPGGDFREKC